MRTETSVPTAPIKPFRGATPDDPALGVRLPDERLVLDAAWIKSDHPVAYADAFAAALAVAQDAIVWTIPSFSSMTFRGAVETSEPRTREEPAPPIRVAEPGGFRSAEAI